MRDTFSPVFPSLTYSIVFAIYEARRLMVAVRRHNRRMTPLPLLAAVVSLFGYVQSDGEMKLREFVAALNTQDQAKVEDFVRNRVTPSINANRPISERAARLFQLAKVGTPLV